MRKYRVEMYTLAQFYGNFPLGHRSVGFHCLVWLGP